jgi:predicted metalloprotease with PDZ domain
VCSSDLIREQTRNKKSMDDFCHLFHGGQSGPPAVSTYTFDDVVNTLNQVAAYDWRGFWTERLTNHGPGAPLSGIERSGWKLVYDDTPSELFRAGEHYNEHVNAAYSIGLLLKQDGTIIDAIDGMAAAKAGIGPGMKVAAVNGRRFSADVLHDALRDASAPLALLVENTEYFKTYNLDYHGGEKYPHLVRDESRPDMLADIIKPR